MKRAIIVIAHPDYPDPQNVAKTAIALTPSLYGLPLIVAIDEKHTTEHVTLVPAIKKRWSRHWQPAT